MKNLLTLLFISISVACLGQTLAKLNKGVESDVSLALKESTLEKTILFSKGEAYTEKEWQDYQKQVLPIVKVYFKRDSAHNKFLSNTVIPNLAPNDSIESYRITLEGIFIKLKAKKK